MGEHHITAEGMAKPVRELTPAQLRAHINELGDCASASSADASRYVALMTEMERRLHEHESLESQLTAARRRDADLRAWVEEKANDFFLRGFATDAFRAMLAQMDRLTEPSPADDAKEPT